MTQIPNLINVLSATKTPHEGILELTVVVERGGVQITEPFGYLPGDTTGMSPQVDAWMAENPGLPIGDAPPAPPKPFENLSPVAFHAMREDMGISDAEVDALIEANIPAGMQRILAKKAFHKSDVYMRENQLLNAIATAKGISQEDLNTKWREAEALTW